MKIKQSPHDDKSDTHTQTKRVCSCQGPVLIFNEYLGSYYISSKSVSAHYDIRIIVCKGCSFELESIRKYIYTYNDCSSQNTNNSVKRHMYLRLVTSSNLTLTPCIHLINVTAIIALNLCHARKYATLFEASCL